MFRRHASRSRRTADLAVLDVVQDLAPVERAALVRRYTTVQLPAGAKVCRQGRAGNELLLVLDGTADVRRNGVHVADVGVGAVLGERSMLLLKTYQDADVVATSDMTLAAVSRREYLDALGEQPSLRTTLQKIAAARG